MKEKRYTTIEWWLLAPRQVCFWILGGTTAFMAWNIALTYFSEQNLPERIIWQLAAIVTFLVWLGVDGALSKLLPFFAEEVTAKGYNQSGRDKKFLVGFMGVTAIALVAASGTMSIWSGGEIADSMTKETDLSDIQTTSKQTSDNYNITLSSIEKELSQARTTEATRLRQANRQGRQLVLSAWRDGSEDYRLIYHNRRSWLNSIKDNSKKYRTLVSWRNGLQQAKRDSANLVAQEKQIVATLLEDKRHILKGQSIRDTTLLVLSGIGLSKVNKDLAKFDRRRKAIIFVEILAAGLVVFFSFLVGYWRRVYEQRIDDENYGIFYLLSKLWSKVWGWLGDKMNTGINNGKINIPYLATAATATPVIAATMPKRQLTTTNPATTRQLVGQAPQPKATTTATKGKTTTRSIVVDLKGLKDNCRNHYKRSFKETSDEATRKENWKKYLQEKEDLEALGFEVIPNPDTRKLTIKKA